ncbi:ribosome biogenesis protein ytm1 [Coemansia sp. RSA 989]|nr:Centromere/kinetochore Zw10-domain-containing protein [Coemansia mojavensis]KAJ1738708.1 ribosome biogenesis protein ytm1 [Coemansia sp. RSA 1086]KAJ1752801.1 ribosome biogenesis protein ytm1 [Coemansia sp. RSA 1821]KAJ1864561.1 ribosome biogenesis protein ytm1 [Coemansia sp. RSA 989]KAJ1875215.1 ribosome biogenesis protein ytm1 [Coemansia sp. RSA 990]
MNRSQRRLRRTGITDADFEKQSIDEQLATLEAQTEVAQATTIGAINNHRRGTTDPLDEIATVNARYETTSTRIAQQSNSPSQQINRLDRIGRTLRTIVRMAKTNANLRDISEQLLHGDIAVASSAISEANEMLLELEDDVYVRNLHKQFVWARAAARAEVERIFGEMIVIQQKGSLSEMTVTFVAMGRYDGEPFENAVTLGDLVFAMRELDLVYSHMDKLADSIADQWLLPLLQSPALPLNVSQMRHAASLSVGAFKRAASDSLVALTTSEKAAEHCSLVQEQWSKVLDFIRDFVFYECADDNADLLLHVGHRLWKRVWPLLNQTMVPRLAPDVAALSDAQCLTPLAEIEHAWVSAGLLPAVTCVPQAARELLQTHVATRRCDLLSAASAILASEDSSCSLVGPLCDAFEGKKKRKDAKGSTGMTDAESVVFPRCSVSTQAQMLMDFAHETIALTSSPSDLLHVHAVRDAFALYKCLIPQRLSVLNIKQAFIVHNDCMFFCHHLPTLAFRVRPHWPKELQATSTFVDLLASFRALAKEALSLVLDHARTTVVHEMGVWKQQNCWEALDEAERNLQIACAQVTQIAHIADAHLPSSTHLSVVGLLLDVVASLVIKRLQEVSVAGDSRARALVRLISPLLDLDRLFLCASDPASANTIKRKRAPIVKYSSEWNNLQAQISRLSCSI